MVINKFVAKANWLANRILGDHIYSKVFGYRHVPEYKALRDQLHYIKTSVKKVLKNEEKWLRMCPNSHLRVAMALLEEKYMDYLEFITAFQKRLSNVIAADFEVDAANNAANWVELLRLPAINLYEKILDRLGSLTRRIAAKDAFDEEGEYSYLMRSTEMSSAKSLEDITESSISIASGTSLSDFAPVCKKRRLCPSSHCSAAQCC